MLKNEYNDSIYRPYLEMEIACWHDIEQARKLHDTLQPLDAN